MDTVDDGTRSAVRVPAVFAAGGAVGRALAAVDWTSTPLGPPEQWPQSLISVVRIMLASRFSMWMAWGPELTFFCNDAYRRDTLGAKYPWALGRPAGEVWAEIWPDIGPPIEQVMDTGVATWDEALLLVLERSGFSEETYHTFSYSPLADDAGQIVGMLCVVSEDTERVIAERRLATLRDLGSDPTALRSEAEVLAAAARHLAAGARDLPFTLTYLRDDDGVLRLAASSGVAAGHPVAPATIDGPTTGWAAAVAGNDEDPTALIVVDLEQPEVDGLPTGGWPGAPRTVAIAPL